MPRLDSAALLEELAVPGARGVLAHHQAGLLAGGLTSHLASLDPDFTFRGEGLVSLPVPLGKALSRAGVSSHQAREALIAEVQHLALVLAGIADDFSPQVHLAVAAAGEPLPAPHRWPETTRLVLLYAFELREAGHSSPAAAAAEIAEGEDEVRVHPSPGVAAVLKLDPAVAVRCVPVAAPGGRGELLLLLWVASAQTPDEAAGRHRSWMPLAPPEPVDVLLISMPFGPVVQPSLGLGLLKSALPAGSAKVLYPSLVFARRIGRPLYHWISDHLPFATTLVGEWLFRPALFPERPGDPRDYLDQVLLQSTRRWRAAADDGPANVTLVPDELVADILQVRELVDEFIDWCVEQVLAHRPRIVGLTSVFQQHAASLALARRLKARSPATRVVLGGSNCEGVMALAAVRAFGFLDAVVSGEGEVILPQLVERWLAGRPIDDLQGVYTRTSPQVLARTAAPANAPSPRHLDDLPYPDFDDFFAQLARAGFVAGRRSRILFETSRGCWWGEKKHCTFCGLNGASMAYRSKSAERALSELRWLIGRYPGRTISTVDNILDMQYFKTLLPQLAQDAPQAEIFYEVKSNLRKDQIRLLRAAGVTSIQAGIESFSDEVLRLMGKGVKGLQNVRLLKWCLELGVWPYWNMLWGFPGETPEEYARMAELVPRLHHLPPPVAMSSIYVERFSPNHFRSEEMGFAGVRPMPAYEHIYPVAAEDLAELAFFFEHGYQDGRDVDRYVRPLVDRIAEWREVYSESTLAAIDRGDHLLILDTRPAAVESLVFVEGLARTLYLACDDITTIDQLQRTAGADLTREQVEDALQPLLDGGLMVRQGDALLALAIARTLAD